MTTSPEPARPAGALTSDQVQSIAEDAESAAADGVLPPEWASHIKALIQTLRDVAPPLRDAAESHGFCTPDGRPLVCDIRVAGLPVTKVVALTEAVEKVWPGAVAIGSPDGTRFLVLDPAP